MVHLVILLSFQPIQVIFPMAAELYLIAANLHKNNFYGIVVQNSDWVTVRGIRCTNVPQQISNGVWTITGAWWVISSSNILIDNCEGDHSMTGFRLDGGSNTTFNNCDAHHMDDPYTGAPTGAYNGSDGFQKNSFRKYSNGNSL